MAQHIKCPICDQSVRAKKCRQRCGEDKRDECEAYQDWLGEQTKPDSGIPISKILDAHYARRDNISYIVFPRTRNRQTWVAASEIYGILAAPPCTVFSKACWNIRKEDRKFASGMIIVRACLDIIWTVQECGAPLKFWALENPMGYLYNFLGRPVFYFQPWQFGDITFLATKRTALWGYFNKPAKTVRKRTVPFISSHSIAKGTKKENKPWYSARAKERSITPPGFAQAFFKANR